MARTAEVRSNGAAIFRVLCAYDDMPTHECLHSVSSGWFSEASWSRIRSPTEGVPAGEFRFLARAGAAAYELVRVRRRTWPYKLFDCLRSQHTVSELEATRACVLDEFSNNFRAFTLGAWIAWRR
jgi:hypothetical protein